jgi:PST family polysaccharide transporter
MAAGQCVWNTDETTDPMKYDFALRARVGRRFTYSQRIFTFLINFATIAILARLVPPAEFGLMAMITTIVNFLTVFRDLGLTSATIQTEILSDEQRGTLFYFNAIATMAIFALLVLSAPLISGFYHQPSLQHLVLGASAGFLIAGLGAQHASVLRRNLAFREIFLAEVSGIVAGSATTIMLAAWWHDAWSLVVGGIVQAAISTLLYFSLCGWVPRWTGNFRKSLHLLAFGVNVSLFTVFNYATNSVGAILVGYLHGPTAMGFYSRAQSLYALPVSFLLSPYLQVQFPLMCRFRDDARGAQQLYLDIIRITSLLFIPAGMVLPFVGVDFVTVLLGARWAEAGIVFCWFSPAVIALGLIAPFGQYMISQGRVTELRLWAIGDVIIRGGGAVLGSYAGSAGAAAGFSLATLFVAVPIIVWLCGRRPPVSRLDQIKAAIPGVVCGTIAGIAATVAHLSVVHANITDARLSLFFVTTCSVVALSVVAITSRPVRTSILTVFRTSTLPQN